MNRRTDEQKGRGLTDHVFVCTNDRDSEYACCRDAHGPEVEAAIKEWLRERNAFWSTVSVSSASCLGLCSEEGTAVTIQPRDEWYDEVTPADVPDLLEAEFGPDAEELPGEQ
ncbi:(2Fe-2S) ferredoxin domain-containing protein [Natrialbaceae archaeon AArc-T1-2]|uniref:(2Fe-2S) ferredoxin domain-containing protein n=1 Tax=Natrialbaceae archaeon AArc-T1-2 TaxID=3053904 RepID=UPI00255AA52A|nr:(2Fe-2S) ferredoxin domain-containing protein [Natrialbaceae archaeon AArc-T1-2]WIV68233.1 (2Fe-2S) ferredoxin domain-containing protein [Natrialbaceae archaeon AArc-T1-2]